MLRKTPDGQSIEHEARIIEYVGGLGLSVPAIHEVPRGGTEIAIVRIVDREARRLARRRSAE